MNNSGKTKSLGFILINLIFTVFFLTGCTQSEENKINELIKTDDAHYKIEIAEDNSLILRLPEGRPKVPKLSCEGAAIAQAVFPDGCKDAIAKISTDKQYYVVRFIKDPSLGFELQYDDRYKFVPKTIAADKFYSSNPKIAEVDDLGNVKIVGVSDDGAVISYNQNGESPSECVLHNRTKQCFLLLCRAGDGYSYKARDCLPLQ